MFLEEFELETEVAEPQWNIYFLSMQEDMGCLS